MKRGREGWEKEGNRGKARGDLTIGLGKSLNMTPSQGGQRIPGGGSQVRLVRRALQCPLTLTDSSAQTAFPKLVCSTVCGDYEGVSKGGKGEGRHRLSKCGKIWIDQDFSLKSGAHALFTC